MGAPQKIGLILTGGGARAAYQVGVLKAIAEFLPRRSQNPFPVICVDKRRSYRRFYKEV